MFNNDYFEKWLNGKAEEVMGKVAGGESVTSEEMIILVLKAQSNHFTHLDTELRGDMRALRQDMNKDMTNLREDMNKDMANLREDMNKDMANLRRDMNNRFEYMGKEMVTLREDMNKRFEDMNNRFADLIHYVDKRFSTLQWTMGIGFTAIVLLTTLFKFIG